MVGISKVCGLVHTYVRKPHTSSIYINLISAFSSDNLISHDKNGHGNLYIDFSGSFHIY